MQVLDNIHNNICFEIGCNIKAVILQILPMAELLNNSKITSSVIVINVLKPNYSGNASPFAYNKYKF